MSAPARRSGLMYADEEAIVADVAALRKGYVQAGSWTLPQMCWHMEKTIVARMQPGPFPPNTPEQVARRGMLDTLLAGGSLPGGIQAPDGFVPGADVGDDAIDSFIAVVRRFRGYTGPIAPHRLFGHLTEAEAKKLNLIHCAHHLSHLSRAGA